MMEMSRRDFVRSVAATGAGVALANSGALAAASAGNEEINIAMIGCGKQGRVLLQDTLKIPGIRFQAICDVWEYSQKRARGRLRRNNPEVKVYTDYREMLDKEKGIDAAIVATPDFVHTEHTMACLEAGLDVYCEKEMSNDLDQARQMAQTSIQKKKLLQIGHQRRSNPIYRHAAELIDEGLCGRMTNLHGQWNRPPGEKLAVPERIQIPADVLKKYGYESMDHFLNWRWYRKYSAGPIADLGSHQIDIFSWFLGCEPSSVMSVGGSDYYPDREWFEDVMCLYEYQTKKGSARAFYQVINTNAYGFQYHEKYGGDKGTFLLSENDSLCMFIPAAGEELPDWMASARQPDYGEMDEKVSRDPRLKYANSLLGMYAVPLTQVLGNRNERAKADMAAFAEKNVHQFHLENFFEAVRKQDKSILTCPAEVAYPTAVAVLNVIPAVEAGKKIEFTEASYRL